MPIKNHQDVNDLLNIIYHNREVKWRYLGQFSTKPLLYSDISPLIFICGIFIVSNQRFMVVYHG